MLFLSFPLLRLPLAFCGPVGPLAPRVLPSVAPAPYTSRFPRAVLFHLAFGNIACPAPSHESPRAEVRRYRRRAGSTMNFSRLLCARLCFLLCCLWLLCSCLCFLLCCLWLCALCVRCFFVVACCALLSLVACCALALLFLFLFCLSCSASVLCLCLYCPAGVALWSLLGCIDTRRGAATHVGADQLRSLAWLPVSALVLVPCVRLCVWTGMAPHMCVKEWPLFRSDSMLPSGYMHIHSHTWSLGGH